MARRDLVVDLGISGKNDIRLAADKVGESRLPRCPGRAGRRRSPTPVADALSAQLLDCDIHAHENADDVR
ncbi:MAG: hypothetical protein JWO42_3806, partial [Chloroflexi bacterium]|nr:hypothetical protein [Chloroflexota bacterium]